MTYRAGGEPYLSKYVQQAFSVVRMHYPSQSHPNAPGERDIDLTAREYDLLEFMARNPRRIHSRELLLSQVWDVNFGVTTNVAEVYIAYLRKKVDAPGEPKLVHAVRDAGYALKEA
jgi:DNA-binding response OmpR family regulator